MLYSLKEARCFLILYRAKYTPLHISTETLVHERAFVDQTRANLLTQLYTDDALVIYYNEKFTPSSSIFTSS